MVHGRAGPVVLSLRCYPLGQVAPQRDVGGSPNEPPLHTARDGLLRKLTAAILAGLAQARYNSLEQSCPACSESDIDAGRKMAVTADVLFGVGGAAVVGGLVWYLVDRFWTGRARASAGVRTSRFPALGVTAAGVSIGGAF